MHSTNKAKARRGANTARIYHELRRRILNLDLAPGADLDEMALANAFNISRTPLREALNRLASEQLVVISPNRGASVAPLTLTDFPAFIESLALAQSAVNAFAAMRRSDQDLAAIAAAADAFEAALEDEGVALTEANRAFRSAIAEAARKPPPRHLLPAAAGRERPAGPGQLLLRGRGPRRPSRSDRHRTPGDGRGHRRRRFRRAR